ncbi:MAG: SpoIIE family protein phosphatase [Pseudonocardiaceae bacterium]
MASRLMRRFRLRPSPHSPSVARSLLRGVLAEARLESLIDVALLLATELCSNAVRHAGTEMELTLSVDESRLTVEVIDRGPVPLEINMATGPGAAQPRSGGYGLQLVAALASSWGTRHDATGRHVVWFCLEAPGCPGSALDPASGLDPALETGAALESPPTPGDWPQTQICRWLLHIPEQVTTRLDVPSLVAELLRRLGEVLGADDASVSVDHGDGRGEQLLARYGETDTRPAAVPPSSTRSVIDVRLPVEAPLHGRLRVVCPTPRAADEELAELSAHRIALAIESDWLRGADRHRRSWMTYLADTSELLAQSLDVDFTAALVPQIVVPRLGEWCAVHVVDELGKITRATWGHADESALAPLRSWLDGTDGADTGALRRRIDEALLGTRPIIFTTPVEGVTVPLIARGATLGTLTVGRSQARLHTPEDVALISDVARRASLALSNAQLNAAHVSVSQAFQRALLPRALPVAERVEFAAAYLPASAGTDVGGDFYDVLALSGERWLVSCGDVCGKGAPAAARTGLVRDVLRVLVRDGCQLERAIRLLNDAMGEPVDEQQFCTLAAALVTRRANKPGLAVELVLAGHDQPLLLRADSSTQFLGEFGTAVGMVQDMQLWTTRHILTPGDAMVIYTDGVTERRNGGEFFGRTRLAELATRLTGVPAASIAAALRTATRDFSSDPPKDDIALLVVKAR